MTIVYGACDENATRAKILYQTKYPDRNQSSHFTFVRLSTMFWAKAVNTTVYIWNRTSSGKRSITPYELWTGKAPDLTHLRIFGSEAYVHIDK
ncbi:Copia protein [Dufourea novaeangliae]|uniref:Copia protein n=1 Tax=Dufourea novaeangliae TaxID=178035 RepID=A0A154P4N6_DUFNO|nr:Copia protein [Dufourea novaeangliae]